MDNNQACKKVVSLLSLYVDNKVTYSEREFIEEHLAFCPECYQKYMYLKQLIYSLKDSYRKVMEMAMARQKSATFSIREHEKFMENISPYIDNELEPADSFEFRRYLMKSKMAQKELRNTYFVQREIKDSFEKAKKNLKKDFSKSIIAEVNLRRPVLIKPKVYKVAILAGLVLFGAAGSYQFYEPVKHKIQKTVHKYENPKIEPKTSSESFQNNLFNYDY